MKRASEFERPEPPAAPRRGALTEAERGGAFEDFGRFKRVMGPAGEGKEWHHVVEETRSNVEKFGAGRIHNVNNLVPIRRHPEHQSISNISNSTNYPGTDGRRLYQFLGDKSFAAQKHVGDQLMRDQGLSPEKLRAMTLERFERRIVEIDRTKGTEIPEMADPGAGRAEGRGQRHTGRIVDVEGDRVFQHVGRGDVIEHSKAELIEAIGDEAAVKRALQPGKLVSIAVGAQGVDLQVQRGSEWRSIGQPERETPQRSRAITR